MEKTLKLRIKLAGKNISNVSYLMLVSNVIPIIAFFHIWNLELSDVSEIGKYYLIYGIAYLVIATLIIVNIYNAGNNLSLCDIELNERKIEGKETKEIWNFKDNKRLEIISKNNVIIGAEAFMNDEIAPDGEYEYINGTGKLIIRDGKVEKKVS